MSFRDFTRWAFPLVTGAEYAPNAISERIVDTLQRVADGELTRVLVACPPGCAKSTLLTIYGAWRLARDAGHRTIRGSHAFDIAATESRRLRRLVLGDDFQRVFRLEAREDENTAAMWSTTAGGRYIAVGVGGGLTGRRADEAIVDDALNAPDRFSRAARDACWAWFTEALSTRLDGNAAPMIVVMQRLDRDDLVGRLIAAGGWTLVECPAEVDGEPQAPNVLPRAKLDAIRATIGAAAYSCQYLERPASDDDAMIKRAWWRFHHGPSTSPATPRPSGCNTEVPAVDTPTTFDRVVIACDLTFGGQKTSNDPACIVVWGRSQGAKFLLDLYWKRSSQLAQLDAIRALKARFPTARVVIEKAAAGAGLIEILHKEGVDAIGVPPIGSKSERLAVVSPAIESGQALLPLGHPRVDEMVEEMAGNSSHDDFRDACALALTDLAGGSTDWSGFGAMMARIETAPPTPLGAHEYSFGAAASAFAPPKAVDAKPEPTPAERSAASWALRDQDPMFRIAVAPALKRCPGGCLYFFGKCRTCGGS